MHFQQSINDIKINDIQAAISELNKVIISLAQEKGVLMTKGILPSTTIITS
jgi:hypothetical protein